MYTEPQGKSAWARIVLFSIGEKFPVLYVVTITKEES